MFNASILLGGIMKNKAISLIVSLSFLLSSAPLYTSADAVNAKSTTDTLHSISELNLEADALDSHSGVTSLSTLESDYRRSYRIDNEEFIDEGYIWYPRTKKLSSGKYIMFFQDGRWGPNIYYTLSDDGLNWEKPTYLFKAHITEDGKFLRNYATADAIELENGDILVSAIFQPSRISSDTPAVSRWDMLNRGIITKISHDGGQSFEDEQIIYHGRCWEPSFLQLPDGSVQMYFTQSGPKDAVYGSALGSHVSSGVGMFTSCDNGASWTPTTLTYPYVTKRIVQNPIYEYNGITILTDQMPVSVLLHDNETIVMVVESMRPDQSGHSTSIIRSHDFFETTLEEDEYGPSDRDDFIVSGAAPYIAQFPSGEIAISNFHSHKHKVYLGNELGTEFDFTRAYIPLKNQTVAMWGDLFVADSHTLIASAGDTIVEAGVELNLTSSGMGFGTMVLNHRIDAKKLTATIDASSTEWANNTDALFVGSESQAQVSVRYAHDENYVYALAEVLDDDVCSSDAITLYLKGESSDEVIVAMVNSKGEYTVKKNTSSAQQSVSGVACSVKKYTSQLKGYAVELALPISLFSGEGTLRTFVKLTNKDGGKTYVDTFDGVSESDDSTWHMIVLSSTLALPNVYSSESVSVWDGVSANVGWYAKNTEADEFFINSAEELYGLSLLCSYFDSGASLLRNSRLYYDSEYNVILDKEKITDATPYVKGTKLVGETIRLTCDVDLDSHRFLPIGSTGSFQGLIFDGGGHTIKNLYVNAETAMHKTLTTQYFFGLFAATASNCTVQNLRIEDPVYDVNVPSSAKSIYLGGISAYSTGNTAFYDCIVDHPKIIYRPADGIQPTACLFGGLIGKYETPQRHENVTVYDYEIVDEKDLGNWTSDSSLLFGRITKTGVSASFYKCKVYEKEEILIRKETPVWDGVSANVGWYAKNTEAPAFYVSNGEELYALSLLCSSFDPKGSLFGDAKLYYDENYDVIFDRSKINENTAYVTGTKLVGEIVKLSADIDLGGHVFLPIGSSGSYQGKYFDGCGYTIKNLYVDPTTALHKAQPNQYYFGLFAAIASNCTVLNLNIENVVFDINVNANAKYVYAGGLSAFITGSTKFTNCTVAGLTINYSPAEAFSPTSCMIGAMVGKFHTAQTNSNVHVWDLVLNDSYGRGDYESHESLYYGVCVNTTLPPSFENCSVKRKMQADYGDYNGDGSITNEDLSILIRALSGWNVACEVYDLNSDGKVSNRDALRIIVLLCDPTTP